MITTGATNCTPQNGGNRAATVLLYLNDVNDAGGETVRFHTAC
jgi:hypothetical protein